MLNKRALRKTRTNEVKTAKVICKPVKLHSYIKFCSYQIIPTYLLFCVQSSTLQEFSKTFFSEIGVKFRQVSGFFSDNTFSRQSLGLAELLSG